MRLIRRAHTTSHFQARLNKTIPPRLFQPAPHFSPFKKNVEIISIVDTERQQPECPRMCFDKLSTNERQTESHTTKEVPAACSVRSDSPFHLLPLRSGTEVVSIARIQRGPSEAPCWASTVTRQQDLTSFIECLRKPLPCSCHGCVFDQPTAAPDDLRKTPGVGVVMMTDGNHPTLSRLEDKSTLPARSSRSKEIHEIE